MLKIKFSEEQLAIRNKLGYQSFIFMLILIFINIMANESYMWADYFTQSFILIIISVYYFLICGLLKGLFLTSYKKYYIRSSIFSIIFSVVFMVVIYIELFQTRSEVLIKDGVVQRMMIIVVYLLLNLIKEFIQLIIIVKNKKKKNINDIKEII